MGPLTESRVLTKPLVRISTGQHPSHRPAPVTVTSRAGFSDAWHDGVSLDCGEARGGDLPSSVYPGELLHPAVEKFADSARMSWLLGTARMIAFNRSRHIIMSGSREVDGYWGEGVAALLRPLDPFFRRVTAESGGVRVPTISKPGITFTLPSAT